MPPSDASLELVPNTVEPYPLVAPVATLEALIDNWNAFVEVKNKLLTAEGTDWLLIQGKPRILKAGWRKVAAAFGISDELVRELRREYDGYFSWEMTVRAIAPNGRYAEGVGSCASNERRYAHPDHDVRAQAHTRAKNRAISDLVGGGEVSAEELVGVPIVCQEDGCGAHLRAANWKNGTTWDADQLAVAGQAKFGMVLCSAHYLEHVRAEREVGVIDAE